VQKQTNIVPVSDEPRPEPRSLVFLDAVDVVNVKGIGPKIKKKLASAGVESVADLLLSTPRRYLDRSQLFDIGAAPYDEEVTIGGVVETFNKRRISRGRTMVEARVSDGTSPVRVVWFNPYISLAVGDEVALSGKLESFKGSRQMKGPDVDKLSGPESLVTGRVVPVYGGLGGLRPAQVRNSVANALRRSLPMADVLPVSALSRFNLVDRATAFQNIHLPDELRDVSAAKRRLIFDEFLRIQMAFKVSEHDGYATARGVKNVGTGTLTERFLEHFPFTLTPNQMKARASIVDDLVEPAPMHRLLQGEVGSGKTVVVVLALLASVEGGHQGVVMAPTEVLATQHYLGIERILKDASMEPKLEDRGASGTEGLFVGDEPVERSVRIGLFTGSRVTTNFVSGDISRAKGLAWLGEGLIDIAFGTQALIQPDVSIHDLGLAVVDEQHRFGVEQRVQLRAARPDGAVPDLLLMTATPIPRTFAMVLYGDLKVSEIEGLPPGRSTVATSSISEGVSADDAIDEAIVEQVEAGRQVFVVCPLVNESDEIDAHAATTEFERMSTSLPGATVGLLHGQLKSEEKATIMESFRGGDIDVLVATTVIEVGIDVPNATLIVVRNAERFGLSQLHQLRGRVGRGDYRGACLLVVDASTPEAEMRIEAMLSSTDGKELARTDLEIRGQGTVFGDSQSGAADLRLGDILRDGDLLTAAGEFASEAIEAGRHSELVVDIYEEAMRFLGTLPEAIGGGVEA
jgi:ATP-dependent DNA helicase RecG